jgi:signal transduction histidine kinase
MNACEATAEQQGRITIDIFSGEDNFEIRIADNGQGIPLSVRNTLFDPFVSAGKSNGTGLGLAIVSKIVHDHRGTVILERTSEEGTVFLIRLPRFQQSVGEITQEVAP